MAIALVLMEAGLVSTIQTGITLYGVLACAWIGAIVEDVTICNPVTTPRPCAGILRYQRKGVSAEEIRAVKVGAVTRAFCD
ncbi:hypothetical protein [Komagataeibacter swingsii]|uniref:hypothetical protein n=1 Tax=Komagataeibacter swingsii TaxID=215220 RepID=UPI002230801E|nr:hypothetical protein [Komagataeibacter swingsii]